MVLVGVWPPSHEDLSHGHSAARLRPAVQRVSVVQVTPLAQGSRGSRSSKYPWSMMLRISGPKGLSRGHNLSM